MFSTSFGVTTAIPIQPNVASMKETRGRSLLFLHGGPGRADGETIGVGPYAAAAGQTAKQETMSCVPVYSPMLSATNGASAWNAPACQFMIGPSGSSRGCRVASRTGASLAVKELQSHGYGVRILKRSAARVASSDTTDTGYAAAISSKSAAAPRPPILSRRSTSRPSRRSLLSDSA